MNSSQQVLILVENSNTAAKLRDCFAGFGITSQVANPNETALQACLNHKPAVVILDAHMPYASGHDLLEIIYHTPETSHTKVILLSSMIDPAGTARAKSLGAANFMVNSVATIPLIVERAKRYLPVAAN